MWEKMHNVPYVRKANSVFLCSVFRNTPVGATRLIVGHVFRVVTREETERPLVNYQKNFCSIDDDLESVADASVQNPRLED